MALSSYGESIALPSTPPGLLIGFGLTDAERLPEALGGLSDALEAARS